MRTAAWRRCHQQLADFRLFAPADTMVPWRDRLLDASSHTAAETCNRCLHFCARTAHHTG
jgi:hypothetical protein